MAKATGKQVGHWNALSGTAEYLTKLESIIGMAGIQSNQGGTPETTGTWAVKEVAIEFDRWLSQSKNKAASGISECSIRDCLAEKMQGEIEVPCRAGIVDIITSSEIIEVKKIKHWKAAIGQALVYACEFKELKPRIHLFGKASADYKLMIVEFCSKLSVSVSFEDI